jgi:hypothetical protein
LRKKKPQSDEYVLEQDGKDNIGEIVEERLKEQEKVFKLRMRK